MEETLGANLKVLGEGLTKGGECGILGVSRMPNLGGDMKKDKNEELLDAPTVAARLGVHRRTVLRFIGRDYFPRAFKAGQGWRIPKGDLDDFIEMKRRERQNITMD